MTTQTPEKTDLENEQKDIAKHKGERTSGGQIARLEIKSFGELENLAMILGKSDIVPKDMIGKPANILLAMMFGNEIGLSPAQALQNVMVVNGRPSLWGDAVMGLVLASPVYEDSADSYDPATKTATFKAKRKGKDWVIRTFSWADAVTAKLDKKEGPWQQYPTRMLFHRARSWALRDTFADVLKGLRYYEEERDVIETTAVREGKAYALPEEKKTDAPAQEAAPAKPASVEGPNYEATFLCGGGAATEFEGAGAFIIRDDAETPTKYYHTNVDWNTMAKAAKAAKAYLTATWTEKHTSKGPVRWLVALSLKS